MQFHKIKAIKNPPLSLALPSQKIFIKDLKNLQKISFFNYSASKKN